MKLTPRQKRHIAAIIARYTGWMVGWGTDEYTEVEAYTKAAEAIARYLKRGVK